MKNLLLSALLLFSCSAAWADSAHEITVTDSTYDQSINKAVDDMVARRAEAEGWCDHPQPELKKGEVAIIWTRDPSGKCTQQHLIDKK